MKQGVSYVILLAAISMGFAVAGEGGPVVLPEPVVGAWTRTFPGTTIVRVKTKNEDEAVRYELKLMDKTEPKGFEVVFDAAGTLIEESRHVVAEDEALKTLRFFALFGVVEDQAPAVWTAEKGKRKPRRYALRIDDCNAPGRLEAAVLADGKLNVTLDQRLKKDAEQKRGRFEGRFDLAPGLTLLPEALQAKAGTAGQPATKTDGQPATKTDGQAEAGQEQEQEEQVPEEVLRKIRRLIRATLSEDAEDRDEGWKQLRNMGNLAVPGLAAVARHKDTTPQMLDSLMIALGDSKDPRAGPALAGLLKSSSPAVRQGAARAMGDSGYKDGLPALERLVTDPVEEEEVRLFASVSAAKLGSEAGLDTLKFLADSDRATTRTRAIFALGKYGGKDYVATVAAALEDKEAVVRADAVEALRLIGTDEAKTALARAMADSDHRVRAAALAGLRALTDRKPESILVGALTSKDPKVRGAAAKVLGDLGYKDGLSELEKVLDDADESVRLRAAASAAKLGSGPALLTLKELLKSPRAEVRARALVSLGKHGGEMQLAHVAKCLKDGDVKVRLAAVTALALIGDPGLTRLMDATADKDDLVREAAVESLQALTDQEIGADPAAWRAWWKKSRGEAP